MKQLIPGYVVLASAMLSLAGCLHTNPPPQQQTGLLPGQTGEKSAKLTPAQQANVRVGYGKMMERRNQEAEASIAYTEALKLDPGNVDAALRQAAILDKHGKFADARKLYEKAVELAPKDRKAEVYCNFGYSKYTQHKWAESQMLFSQALALDPTLARAHVNLGMALAHFGHFDEAFAHFMEAGCSRADAHANLAQALKTENKLAEARQQYQLAQRADPRSTRIAQELAELDTQIARGGKNSDS